MYKRLVVMRIITCILSFVIYFVADYFVEITGFLHHFPSYVGIKSFLPVTLGLLFGPYGVIGEIVACTLKCFLVHIPIKYMIMEYICIIIPGLGAWFMWHLKTRTYKIHFRYIFDYIKYTIIVVLTYGICALGSFIFIRSDSVKSIMIWGISLSLLVGIPVIIIYSGLMCLNPVLPPYKDANGKRIMIKDDIVMNLSQDVQSLATLNEQIEDLAMMNKVDFKRVFEIQNCIEEVYLRIIHNMPNIYIDFRATYDITFSVEFNYIGKSYNPLFVKPSDAPEDIAGLNLIKSRALLASYSYLYGENNIHIVI